MIRLVSRRFACIIAIALACLAVTRPARASLLLESGPSYFVVQNDAGGTIGSVVMRMDIVTNSYGLPAVYSQILSISAEPGWTWVIRKSGGLNSAVEVQFFKGKQRFTFKALYVPGKTIIDSGVVK